jgi:hypothetical protein
MKVAREIYEKLGNDRPNKKWVPIPSDYITSMPLDEVGMRHLRNYIVGAMDLYGDDYSEVKGNDYQRTLGAVLRKFDIDSGGSNCRIKVSGKGKQVTIDANLSQIGEDDFFATSGILRFACSRSDVEGQLWDFGAEVTLEELSKTIRARQITSREHTITVESTEFRVTHIGTPGSIERDLKTDYELEEFILKVQSACDKSGLRPVEPIAMDNIGGILFGRKSRHILHVKGGKMKLPHKVTATGHHTFHLADTLEMAGVFIEILTQFRTVTRGPFEEGQLVDVSPLHPSKVLAREVLIEDIFVSGSDLDDLPDIRDRRIRRNIE